MRRLFARYTAVALSLAGSAILLFSCGQQAEADPEAEETMMTEYSENLSVVMSQNGRKSYHFVTPLLEGYTLAKEPYREFRKGIKITTYQDDSLSTVDAVLTANYAIHYEERDLWEARGNVEIRKSDGTELYTQQLFWNVRTKRIYSNVDTKIVQPGNRGAGVGEGFESDDQFKDWRFRRSKVRMEVDVKSREPADSTAAADSSRRVARPERSLRGEPRLGDVRSDGSSSGPQPQPDAALRRQAEPLSLKPGPGAIEDEPVESESTDRLIRRN